MKTIVIIGGSYGIGEAIIKTTINENYIINISRSTPTISHANLKHFKCDILEDHLPELGDIDTLIYCPGSINLKPFSSLTESDFEKDLKINVIGAVKAIKFYLPNLKKSQEASILLFSSVATFIGMPYHSSVAAAKGAVEGLTKSLAAELAPKIRVNAIAPTITNTPLASKILRNDTIKASLAEKHPLKQYLEPSEIASLATYLISSNAKSLTGQVFKLDAGLISITS